MKRLGIYVLSVILLFGVAGCDKKEKKYITEPVTLETLAKQLDSFRKEMEAVNNRTTFGKAIVDFLRDFKGIKPDLNTIEERWPQVLTTTGPENPPEELKPYFKKVSESLSMMRAVLDGKVSRFGGNEDVRKIMRELREVMYYY